jgi:hypothetical protein
VFTKESFVDFNKRGVGVRPVNEKYEFKGIVHLNKDITQEVFIFLAPD